MNLNLSKIANFIVYFLIAILVFFIIHILSTSINFEFKELPKNSLKVNNSILLNNLLNIYFATNSNYIGY